MNFITDIGNTAIKVAITDGMDVVVESRFTDIDSLSQHYLNGACRFEKAIVASVKEIPERFLNTLRRVSDFCHLLTHESKLPFKVEYKTPDTLGSDRLAAIAGAYNKYGQESVLVIDAGTAITFDLLENGIYMGGSISPGIRIRFQALNSFTGRLPLVERSEYINYPSLTTKEAINSGVINGVLFEINEYIRRFEKSHPEGIAVITGGDAGFLDNKTEKKIRNEPRLVTEGLNYILEYNYNVERKK